MVAEPRLASSRGGGADTRRYYVSAALIAVIGAVIFWQAVAYRGLVAVLAEWQFDLLGRYHPLFTYLIIMALVGLPLYLFRFLQRRSVRRRAVLPKRATQRAFRFAHGLLITASLLAVAAVATYVSTLARLGGEGLPVRVRADGTATPPTGAVVLDGTVVYDRVTAFREHLWFLNRDVHFIPVVPRGGGGRGSQLRYFVALPPTGSIAGEAVPPNWNGILRRDELPGEIIRLYRYAGYKVEAPHYVLFTRPDMVTWRDKMMAVQLLIVALIALIGGVLQLGHARWLRRMLDHGREGVPGGSGMAAVPVTY